MVADAFVVSRRVDGFEHSRGSAGYVGHAGRKERWVYGLARDVRTAMRSVFVDGHFLGQQYPAFRCGRDHIVFVTKEFLGHGREPTASDGRIKRRVVHLPSLGALPTAKCTEHGIRAPRLVVTGRYGHGKPIKLATILPTDVHVARGPVLRPCATFPYDELVCVLDNG